MCECIVCCTVCVCVVSSFIKPLKLATWLRKWKVPDEGERIICVSLVATMLLQHVAAVGLHLPTGQHTVRRVMCYVANCLRADVANICFSRRVQVHYSLWQSLNRSNWFTSLPQTLAMASAASPPLSLHLSLRLMPASLFLGP